MLLGVHMECFASHRLPPNTEEYATCYFQSTQADVFLQRQRSIGKLQITKNSVVKCTIRASPVYFSH